VDNGGGFDVDSFESYVEFGRSLIRKGIVIAPWLTWGSRQSRIHERLQDEIRRVSSRLAVSACNPDWQLDLVSGHPISEARAWEAFYVTISGTAVYLSHLELGQMDVTEEMVRVAERLVEQLVVTEGAKRFVSFYVLTTIRDNLQALRYYNGMSPDDFVQGERHRPWARHTLKKELEMAIRSGIVCQDEADGQLRLTPLGHETLKRIESLFDESGFTKFRAQLLRLSNFNSLEDVAAIMDIMSPDTHAARVKYLQASRIEPGATVLEIGCGTGALTFDAGLADIVGPSGRVVALDPSTSMLAALKRKRDARGANWVEIVHARAERIPLPSNTFDYVIACSVMHLVNLDEAVREIARVLKPGGVFVTFHPLHFPAENEFFVEWFEPLLRLVPTSEHKDSLPGPETIPAALAPYFDIEEIEQGVGEAHYTDPRTVVEFYVGVANVFEQAMDQLPWQARQEMIEYLIRRGEEIVQKYPPDKLVEKHPVQFVRARVKK
jgi:SAM-dependent methyltransferase